VRATISLPDSGIDEWSSLYAWLQLDDEFRGRVRTVAAKRPAGAMGGIVDTLVVALGSGGAVAVLATSLSAWMSARRTRICVDLSVGEKIRRVEIDASNASDAERLLTAMLDRTDEAS
jgi:hypothetical protein